jgi:hypothetical protein
MRLRRIKRSAHERALVDASIAAYGEWRKECQAVQNADRRWVRANALEESFAFDAYREALDREEHVARRYASVVSRASNLPETGLAHQLASIHANARAP